MDFRHYNALVSKQFRFQIHKVVSNPKSQKFGFQEFGFQTITVKGFSPIFRKLFESAHLKLNSFFNVAIPMGNGS